MVSKSLSYISPILIVKPSLKCPVAAHWGCLAKMQRDEILRAARDRVRTQLQSGESSNGGLLNRTALSPDQTTEFLCSSCMRGGVCMMCTEVVLEPGDPTKDTPDPLQLETSTDGVIMTVEPNNPSVTPDHSVRADDLHEPSDELLFRCITCKRLAHYEHLPIPPDMDPPSEDRKAVELAEYYQTTQHWRCVDCISYVYSVEHIIAWRPWPSHAVEPSHPDGEPMNYKAALPREYLVKWADRSYRRTQWVPHMWLLVMHPSKLKNFVASGSKITLIDPGLVAAQDPTDADAFDFGQDASRDSSATPDTKIMSPLTPNPDAERQIPPAWKTVDRVLDVLFWADESKKVKQKRKTVSRGNMQDSEKNAELEAERLATYEHGEMPSANYTETVDEYESRTGDTIDESQVDRVAWAFFKWKDLGYEDGKGS